MRARKNTTPETRIATLIIVAVIGLIGCFISYSSNQKNFRDCTAVTQGEVGYMTRRNSRVYYSVSGNEYSIRIAKFLHDDSGKTVRVVTGSKVPVHYNPNRPSQAYAGNRTQAFPYSLLVISVVSGAVGCAGMASRKRK